MSQTWLIVLMIGMAVITYLLRLSFFALQERVTLPAMISQTLRFAPAAVLCGLIAPSILFRQGELALHLGNERLLAALVAGFIARRTKNILVTIVGGMAILWLLQALGI